MMVPAWEPTPFEMIEAQLALHIFVNALGAPALLDQANQLLPSHRDSGIEMDKVKLRRRRLAVLPLHEEPNILAHRRRDTVVVKGNNPAHGKACGELLLGPLTPGSAAKLGPHVHRQLLDGKG